MNWFVVVEDDLSIDGAVRTHVTEFCKALSKYEAVTLISYTKDSPFVDNNNISSISIKPISIRPKTIGILSSTIKLFFSLLKIHRNNKLDVLYIRASAFGFGPLLFARLMNIPGIIEINGIWREEQILSLQSYPTTQRWLVAPIQYLRHLSLTTITRTADRIIAVTQKIAAYLTGLGVAEERITVAPNGVNTQFFSPKDKLESKITLQLDEERIYIGYVGSLTAWQGVDDLINAFYLIERTDQVNLLIVGDGKERENLEKLVNGLKLNKQVHLLGRKPYREVPLYISACEILVAPKKPLQSGYSPLKVYEYMACSRPVIASKVEGLEFIAENRMGLLFSPGDIYDLRDNIIRLLNTGQEEQTAMGVRARQMAEDKYSWDATVQLIRNSANSN